MSIVICNNKIENWKRVLLFSFLMFTELVSSQAILRNSDYRKYERVIIVNGNNKKELTIDNFKSFQFNNGDKVLYDGRLVDIALSNDTIFFFDKGNLD